MNNNNELLARSRELNSSFMDRLSNINLTTAIAVPVVIGVGAVLAGVGIEAHHQGQLLSQGFDTLQQYLNTLSTQSISSESDGGISQYIKEGVSGELPGASTQVQAVGLGIMLYGTAISAGAATLAKGFANVVNMMKNDKEPEFSFESPNPEKVASYIQTHEAKDTPKPKF